MDDIRLRDLLKDELGDYSLTPALIQAIKFIFMNRYESMAIVDATGKVDFVDQLTERIFDLPEGTASGVDVNDIIPDSQLKDILASGKPHIGKILHVKGQQRIVSRFPLIKDGKIIGAFGRVLLTSLEELDRVRGEAQRLRIKVIHAEERMLGEHRATYTFDHILGGSDRITQTRRLAQKMANSDSDVLIYGESGTGKELFAHAIHNESSRRSKPFVRVNCPAIPIEMAESELFGYEIGAFTGAKKGGKPGKFELAQGGTVFLDEIGSLPITIQAKLLRAIQEREIERLGSQKLLRLNIRLIAASNSDLKGMAEHGKFREDLLFRLSKAVLRLPSLKERPEDIPVYVKNFLKVLKKHIHVKPDRISEEALDLLMPYEWPGNVRELINVLEQSLFKAGSEEEILVAHLPDELKNPAHRDNESLLKKGSLKEQIEELERNIISRTLHLFNGNKRRTAQRLGLQRSVLYLKLKKYGIGNND